MAGPSWRNVYDLKDDQIRELGAAEDCMELMMKVPLLKKIFIK